MGGEQDGVMEGVLYASEDVAHLLVAVEGCGSWEVLLDGSDDVLGGFEVVLGSLAEVLESGRCHGGMIRGWGAGWNSLRGTKRAL